MKEIKELDWASYRVEMAMLRSNSQSQTLVVDFLVGEYPGRHIGERLIVVTLERSNNLPDSSSFMLLGQMLYPVEIYVSDSREIVGVKNWKEALRRIRRELRLHKAEFNEMGWYGHLCSSVDELDDEEEFISMLMRNSFFQIMFTNYVGGDRVHLVYDYPAYGDNVPFVYESKPIILNEGEVLYKARLGRISAYNTYDYGGVGKFKYYFGNDFLPIRAHASFIFENDECGFYKKEIKIERKSPF